MNRKEFFDTHASEWDAQRLQDMDARLQRVVELARLQRAQHVLDVGTGTGVLIPHVLSVVGEQGIVVALDISPHMLAQAQRKDFPGNVQLVLADIHQAPLRDASFDRVICNAVFPHFDNKEHALKEAVRVLRSGGLLVISHPIGREAVNRLHMQSHTVIAEDRVPAPEVMQHLLESAGLVQVEVIDEPEFYLARAYKR